MGTSAGACISTTRCQATVTALTIEVLEAQIFAMPSRASGESAAIVGGVRGSAPPALPATAFPTHHRRRIDHALMVWAQMGWHPSFHLCIPLH